MKKTLWLKFLFLIAVAFTLGAVILFKGSLEASLSDVFHALYKPDESLLSNILWELRLPRLFTALLAGAAMGCAGLLIQTYFENPLADPYVLGIHSGSSLAVSLVMVGGFSSSLGFLYSFGVVGASAFGALATLLLLLALFRLFPSKFMILVLGLILGYFLSGVVSILWSLADANELKNYFIWSLGSFSHTTGSDLKVFSLIVTSGMVFSLLMAKPLNLLLLGEDYAKSLGLQGKRIQWQIILLASILSGAVTAFCGPIAFIGIIAPHAARLFMKKMDHRILIPSTILFGIVVALGAEVVSSLSENMILPVNAILSLLGFPWILFLLLTLKKGGERET